MPTVPISVSATATGASLLTIITAPLGQRSFSPWTFTPGISDTSLYPEDSFNTQTSNNHICLIPQIESVKGLENIEEIAQCPGVSGLMFGPGDYSLDAGIKLTLGGVPPQAFIDAMGKFVGTAQKYKLPLFGGAQSPAMIPMMIQQGYAAIAVTFDVWGLAGLVNDGMKAARAVVNGESAENGEKEVAVVGGKENGSS